MEGNLPYKIEYPQTTLAVPGDDENLNTLLEVTVRITKGRD